MRKLQHITKISLLVFFCLVFVHCKKNDDTITVAIEVLNNKSKFKYLYLGSGEGIIDSINLSSDTISFKIKKSNIEEIHSLLGGNHKNRVYRFFSFFTGKDDLKIKFSIPVKDYGIVKDLEVLGGGEEQKAYNVYNNQLLPMMVQQDYLNDEWQKFVKTGNHRDSLLRKPYDEASIENRTKLKRFKRNYITQHTNGTSLYLLTTDFRFSFQAKELSDILDQYSSKYHNSSLYISLREKVDIMNNVAIGAIAPDFTKPDINGDSVSLSDFRGNYVLLDFWASWCSPCRAENPYVVEAYNEFHDKGFEVLGVSYDYPGMRRKWLHAIKEDGMHWTQVSDLLGWKDATAKQYNIRGIPSPFLIDPTGKIIAKGDDLRGENLKTKLYELFQ